MVNHRLVAALLCLLFLGTGCLPESPAIAFSTSAGPTLQPAGGQVGTRPASVEAIFDGVTFRWDAALAQGGMGQWVPEFIDPSGFVYSDLPDHLRFDFLEPYTLRPPFASFQPNIGVWLAHQGLENPQLLPQVFLFPVQEFIATSPRTEERVAALTAYLEGQELPAGAELPVLPMFNSAQDLRAHIKVIPFQNGQGIRFITRYTQSTAPVVNPNVFYTFQGLTDDRNYYIGAFFPVYVAALPDELEVEDWNAFAQGYLDYLDQVVKDLEGMAPGDFEPNLELLDLLIASLEARPQPHIPSIDPAGPYPEPDSGQVYP